MVLTAQNITKTGEIKKHQKKNCSRKHDWILPLVMGEDRLMFSAANMFDAAPNITH